MARVLIGVSGGIAAYKAVQTTRLLIAAGHAVRVIQTPNSRRFVGQPTFAGITGAPVLHSEFEEDPLRGAYPGEPAGDRNPITHLALVQRAELYLIAPASANTTLWQPLPEGPVITIPAGPNRSLLSVSVSVSNSFSVVVYTRGVAPQGPSPGVPVASAETPGCASASAMAAS